MLCTLYIRGLSEKIKKVCVPLGVNLVFKPMRTLRQDLVKVKSRSVKVYMLEKQRGH